MQRRARGNAGFTARKGPPGTKKTGSFANTKKDHMPTAKSIFQHREDKARQAEDEEYLGPPPPDRSLIQLSHVLPGEHLLPTGLDEPGALDSIRRTYKVYITRVKPNVFDIRCDSISRLQQALHAINWAIRDMRLSNEHSTVQFLVQKPTNALSIDMIRAGLSKRPHFISRSPHLVSNASAMDDHLQQLASTLSSSAEGLMALNKSLKLRVNFGHLSIEKRKKGSQDEIAYDDFVKLMSTYSIRGGASFETSLHDADKAEELLRYLVGPDALICNGPEGLRRSCEVTIASQGKEIQANADDIRGQRMQLSMVRACKPENWGRLNWTVSAPDMKYDWNFRVDAWDKVDVPVEFKDLAQKVWLVSNTTEDALLNVPSINTAKLATLKDQIGEIRVKSSATIPYKDTPYVLEVNVTKALRGVRAGANPVVTWGVELYAPHWDESANHISGGRRDWGKGLENIWSDDGPDVKSRLGGFLRTILEVQAHLNRAHPNAAASL
ncbi:hypothetical protein ACJ41O_002949 [Fusarium nematophilum]